MATTTARTTPVVTKIIDGDGHIYERDEDLIPYLFYECSACMQLYWKGAHHRKMREFIQACAAQHKA